MPACLVRFFCAAVGTERTQGFYIGLEALRAQSNLYLPTASWTLNRMFYGKRTRCLVCCCPTRTQFRKEPGMSEFFSPIRTAARIVLAPIAVLFVLFGALAPQAGASTNPPEAEKELIAPIPSGEAATLERYEYTTPVLCDPSQGTHEWCAGGSEASVVANIPFTGKSRVTITPRSVNSGPDSGEVANVEAFGLSTTVSTVPFKAFVATTDITAGNYNILVSHPETYRGGSIQVTIVVAQVPMVDVCRAFPDGSYAVVSVLDGDQLQNDLPFGAAQCMPRTPIDVCRPAADGSYAVISITDGEQQPGDLPFGAPQCTITVTATPTPITPDVKTPIVSTPITELPFTGASTYVYACVGIMVILAGWKLIRLGVRWESC